MFFQDFKNSIDFFLRSNIRLSRKNFEEKNKSILERNHQENEYTYDILARYFKPVEKQSISVLDIGCKNWFYARGEYKFFESFCSDIKFDGVELDAYRLYSNFYNRYETAKYYTRGLKNTHYIVGNLLDIKNKYDYILWFLPFVIEEPLVKWNLPKKFFCPEKLLAHAYSLLQVGGQMLIINQGEIEAIAQKKLLEELNIPYKYLGEVKSQYFMYKNQRFGFLIEKSYNLN